MAPLSWFAFFLRCNGQGLFYIFWCDSSNDKPKFGWLLQGQTSFQHFCRLMNENICVRKLIPSVRKIISFHHQKRFFKGYKLSKVLNETLRVLWQISQLNLVLYTNIVKLETNTISILIKYISHFTSIGSEQSLRVICRISQLNLALHPNPHPHETIDIWSIASSSLFLLNVWWKWKTES